MNCKWLLMVAGFLLLLVPRFLYLEESPPGFFSDEAGAAAHVMCLRQTGKDCNGIAWPVYSRTWGEGRAGPTFQYLGVVWTTVFGGEIYAFRALSVFFTLLTILPLALLVYRYSDGVTAACVAAACLLSPWVFHSSRIAWDPPLAPFFAVLSIYLLACGLPGIPAAASVILAALCCSVAALTYPVVCAHLIFLIPLVVIYLYRTGTLSARRIVLFGSIVAISLGAVVFTDISTVEDRVGTLSIFSDDTRNPTANSSFAAKIPQFLGNVALHFGPRYLAFSGEFNLRHAVKGFGLLAWPETAAILLAGTVMLYCLAFRRPALRNYFSQRKGLFALGFAGYLSAAMAASLTWDSLPHALRSLSGWPFLCLLSGLCLEVCLRRLRLWPLFLGLTVLYCFSFARYYFVQFPADAAWWFDSDVVEALHQHSGDLQGWQDFISTRQYPAQAGNYFERAYF